MICAPTWCAAAFRRRPSFPRGIRSEEHTSELQSRLQLVCRLLLEKKDRHQEPAFRLELRPGGNARSLHGCSPYELLSLLLCASILSPARPIQLPCSALPHAQAEPQLFLGILLPRCWQFAHGAAAESCAAASRTPHPAPRHA